GAGDAFDLGARSAAVGDRTPRQLGELGSLKEAVAPLRGLVADEYLAERAIERYLPRIGLDDARRPRAIAPVDHHRLISLQDCQAAVLAGETREGLDDRMGDLEGLPERLSPQRGG